MRRVMYNASGTSTRDALAIGVLAPGQGFVLLARQIAATFECHMLLPFLLQLMSLTFVQRRIWKLR